MILVVGTKEQENETVAVRRLGGKSQEILALDDAVNTLLKEATHRVSIRSGVARKIGGSR